MPERAVEDWLPVVRRIAARMNVPLDFDDKYQEGAVGVLLAFATWRPERGPLGPHVNFGIRREILDSSRRFTRYRKDWAPHSTASLDGYDVAGTDEQARSVDCLAVRQALVGLPDRSVLERWADGMTLAAIGLQDGVTESRVSQRFTRGCAALRRRLAV